MFGFRASAGTARRVPPQLPEIRMEALHSLGLTELEPEELESTNGGCLFCWFIDSLLGSLPAGEVTDPGDQAMDVLC